MAEKKKVKGIRENSDPNQGALITVDDYNAKTGLVTVTDEVFNQGNYKALCFNVGDVLNTESILINGASQIVIARRISRGTILSVDAATNQSGVIEENKTKKNITFFQPFCKETGIVAGLEVKYDLVVDLIKGGELAVNVEILA